MSTAKNINQLIIEKQIRKCSLKSWIVVKYAHKFIKQTSKYAQHKATVDSVIKQTNYHKQTTKNDKQSNPYQPQKHVMNDAKIRTNHSDNSHNKRNKVKIK